MLATTNTTLTNFTLFPPAPLHAFDQRCCTTPQNICPSGNDQQISYNDLESEENTDVLDELETFIDELKNSAFTVKTETIEEKLRKAAPPSEKLVADLIFSGIEIAGVRLPKVWERYLQKICHLPHDSMMSRLNYARCSEAASESIKLSLQRQLRFGFRESIQKINLYQDRHALVIYNAKPVAMAKNFQEFAKSLQQLQPANPNKPVIICDSRINYHGAAKDWHWHFKKRILDQKNHQSLPAKAFMGVEDFSLPSFRQGRDEFNPRMRHSLREIMQAALGALDEIQSIEQFANQLLPATR